MYPADPSDALHAQYLNALKSENSDVMAVLSIPAIKVRLPVYHGTDDTVLHEGLGHLEGTDLPLGQKGERSFIAGHSGLINARMLDHLDRIEPGDFIEVDVLGEKLVYEVFNTETILPEDFVFPQADPQAATLVLVTCVPYGVNTHRLLVSARRVEKMPDENRTPRIPAEKKTPSAAVWIGIGLISLLIFACIYLRLRTR